MMRPMEEIPQRELRNDVSGVLRRVADGRPVRITVRGRPVADLVPITDLRRFAPRSELESIIEEDPLDAGFESDVRSSLGATVDEL